MTSPIASTMLELVFLVSAFCDSDQEVVSTVAHLINSGRVVLNGSFAGARIDLR